MHHVVVGHETSLDRPRSGIAVTGALQTGSAAATTVGTLRGATLEGGLACADLTDGDVTVATRTASAATT